MKSILDRSFRYVPSHATDLRKTFERIRGERGAAAQGPKAPALLHLHLRRNMSYATRTASGCNERVSDAAQTALVATNLEGNVMKQMITAALLAAIAVAGCTSMPDSIRHPFAGGGNSVQQPQDFQYPQNTDHG